MYQFFRGQSSQQSNSQQQIQGIFSKFQLSKLKLTTLLATTLVLVSFGISLNTVSSLAASNNNSNIKPGDLKLNTRSKVDTDKLLNNLKDKDPDKLGSKTLEKKSDKSKRENNTNFQSKSTTEKQLEESTLVSNQNNLQIETELKTKKVKIKNSDKGDISLNIPNSDKIDSVDIVDNKVIYSGKNSPIDTIVESIDGGVRQVINIKDSSAPNFYDFVVDLEVGDKLEINPDGSAQVVSNKPFQLNGLTEKQTKEFIQKAQEIGKTNTQSEINFNQTVKLSILKPWAKDANGKDLTTSYSIVNGNTLRQTIDLVGAVFPVVADPIWCGDAIDRVTWIYRYPYYSASVYPTWCGAWNSTGQWGAWQEMYRKTPYHPHWDWRDRDDNNPTNRYWSMYNQFACHTDYAKGAKTPWNLEPAKWNVGYWNFVWHACN